MGQERVAAQLVEALGHQRRGEGDRHGRRTRTSPATSCAWRPGREESEGRVPEGRPRLRLGATDVRILAPIPGKQAVGVEVPNARRKMVHLGDVYQEPPGGWSPLTVWLGKDIAGKAIGTDLAKHAPHAGGRHHRLGQVRLRQRDALVDPAARHAQRGALVLVDPKQVELNHYESIPTCWTPVVTSPRLAATALRT